jgi:hypothetical protein
LITNTPSYSSPSYIRTTPPTSPAYATKEIKVYVSPDSLNPTIGSTIKFECIIEAFEKRKYLNQADSLKFSWFKNNVPIEDDSSVLKYGALILRNLIETDSGAYTCQVKDLLTNRISNVGYGSLTVKQPPKQTLSVRVSPKQINVNEGEDFSLDCSVNGGRNTIVEWIKVDDRLDPQRHLRRDNKLIVKEASLDDSGKYECMAENELMQNAIDFAIVNVKPTKIKHEIETYFSEMTDSIEIYCRANFPKSYLKWRRTDRKPISSSFIISSQLDTQQHETITLKTRDLTLSDITEYECYSEGKELLSKNLDLSKANLYKLYHYLRIGRRNETSKKLCPSKA